MAEPAKLDPLQPHAGQPRGVTWRSVLIGTIATALVCLLTPYNDFVLSDTSLAAGFVPLAAVVVEFFLIVMLNAPLLRWFPRAALNGREMAVIVLMTLIACSLPNWGLMKFLIPMPVSPFRLGQEDMTFWNAFKNLHLPAWLFPVPVDDESRNSDVVNWFYNRIPPGAQIPWHAWIAPFVGWGIFAGAMVATLVAVARLLVDQWQTTERLPFPLVEAQAQLIEPPAPGRALNALFLNPLLWAGLLGVIFVHTLNCMHDVYPKYVPQIPLGYNFSRTLFADPPYSYLRAKVQAATLSFTLIGVTYFVRSRAAFSLIVGFISCCVVDIYASAHGATIPSAAWQDENLGASIAFILGIFWIGREHWKRVLRNAFGVGEDNSYRITFWIAILGVAVMFTWLVVVGVKPWMAGVIVVFIVSAHLVVSRVVAETGLPWFRSSIAPVQVYSNLPITWLGGRDVFFSGVFGVLGSVTTRDGIMGFSMHGMGIARKSGVQDNERRWLGSAIVWTLLVGITASAVSTMYCQYNYPTPVTRDIVPQRNNFGALYVPKRDIADPFASFSEIKSRTGAQFASKAHSPGWHMAIGFSIVTLLQTATLRFANWPILPVGFVASYGAFIENAWFSVMIGWIAKALIVRFGGSSLYTRARPLFVGMIFGECLAAAGLLLVNAIFVYCGGDPLTMKFML